MVYYNTRGSADGVYPPTVFAGIITEVQDANSTVSLAVFGPAGLRFEANVSQGSSPGQWDWMPFPKDQQTRLAQNANTGVAGDATQQTA